MPKSSPSLCLIGGTGRSGTTILKRIFARHPHVAYVPETRFLVDPDGIIDFFNTLTTGWSPYLFNIKLKRLERLLRDVGWCHPLYRYINGTLRYLGIATRLSYKLVPRYVGLNLIRYCPDYFDLVEQLLEQLVDFRYRGTWIGAEFGQETSIGYSPPPEVDALANILGDFARQVAQSVVVHQQAQHYVEDNTWSILWVDKIFQLLPEAKLVHIYRDPRDVVASYTWQDWLPSDPIQAAKLYRDLMKQWWTVRQHISPDTFIEISLEALVADPPAVLRPVCDFWGIEWDEVLLMTDLSHANIGRWRKDLTSAQQKQVSQIIAAQLAELGYQDD